MRERGGRIARLAGVGLLATMTLAASACGGQPAPPVTPADPMPTPTTALPTPTTAPTAPTASIASESASSAPAGDSVIRDDALLAVLPPELDGVPVVAEEESFREAAADPAFAGAVERAAFALVASPDDLASGVVAKPREGLLDAAFFQDWRETYNEGACAQAGGVATNAEAELGGRTVHITTCAEGITVYHALLEERGLVVSVFSLGAGRYGERLMRDLRP